MRYEWAWGLIPHTSYAYPIPELLVAAVRAVSFFNTIALLWLGGAVVLNAERRVAGTWLAGGGLLAGGLFFAGHTAVVGREIGTFDREMEFWWRGSWLAFLAAPYLWYLVMAWYSGRFSGRAALPNAFPAARSSRLQPAGPSSAPRGGPAWRALLWRWLVPVLVTLGGAGALLLLVARPLPSYGQLAAGGPLSLAAAGVPLAVLVYPGYSVLCIGLAVAALRRPAASERFMGDLARRRARPWLLGASLVLLLESFTVGAVAAWFLEGAGAGSIRLDETGTVAQLLVLDLVVSLENAAAVVLMGRAIVSYEVFTGKTLPRRGLYRHWRSSLILAAGYGGLMAAGLWLPVDPIYRVLMATVLLAAFYALVSWRSYVERERGMERLRPFVASQRLYDRVLGPPGSAADEPLAALCDAVLGARVAHLVPLGPLAALCGPPLTHPPAAAVRLPHVPAGFGGPEVICSPVDPVRYGGASWAVPLWNDHGPIGVLLLGEKRDGTLYTQEEMEVARAAGERLIDARASAELGRRLILLERQRLAESQVLDQRARRVLHDDVLPLLHTAILTLRAAPPDPAVAEVQQQLAEVHRTVAALLRALPASLAPEVSRLGLLGALRQVFAGELAAAFERVSWDLAAEAEQAAAALPPLTAEVLFCAAREAARNAARHGRGDDPGRPLHLTVSASVNGSFRLAVMDDGAGVTAAPAPPGGTGQGLVLHTTLLALVGGSLTLESVPGVMTSAVMTVPVGDGEGRKLGR